MLNINGGFERMQAIVYNTFDGKKYKFSTYFIITNNQLIITKNNSFEDDLINCFYIKRFGSITKPKIYLDEKKNNEWINKNKYIGGYNSLMDLIVENENSFICIRGFTKSSIMQFIRMINKIKGTNIKITKLKNEISNDQSTSIKKLILKKDI